ncbi:hypothetical protein BOMU111920_07710 [Bordetella muralis]
MGVCILEYGAQDCGANTLSLMVWQDVKMVQKPVVLLRANQNEAYSNIIRDYESTQRRIKRCQKALSGALWVKTPNALQALAHCSNTHVDQDISIG